MDNNETNKFNEPYISLKFGSIKSIDFNGNEEAKKFYDNSEYTEKRDIEIIKGLEEGDLVVVSTK